MEVTVRRLADVFSISTTLYQDAHFITTYIHTHMLIYLYIYTHTIYIYIYIYIYTQSGPKKGMHSLLINIFGINLNEISISG